MNSEAFLAEDIPHAPDLRTHTFELLFYPFIATVHVIDTIQNGFAVGYQGRKDKRCGCAEVGTHDCSSGERRRTANSGSAAFDFNVGAHADQFLNVHEPIFKDVL